jgi:hypothetical protein
VKKPFKSQGPAPGKFDKGSGAGSVEPERGGYIDSSGVASLVEGLKAFRDLGSRLALYGLSEPAREVLKISRLLKLFGIYEDETAGRIFVGDSLVAEARKR